MARQLTPPSLSSIIKWTPLQREKIADATALLISQGLASGECLVSLTKDHLVKECESATCAGSSALWSWPVHGGQSGLL